MPFMRAVGQCLVHDRGPWWPRRRGGRAQAERVRRRGAVRVRGCRAGPLSLRMPRGPAEPSARRRIGRGGEAMDALPGLPTVFAPRIETLELVCQVHA